MRTIDTEIRKYTPITALDELVPRKFRRPVTMFAGVLAFMSGIVALGFGAREIVSGVEFTEALSHGYAGTATGVFCIVFSVYAVLTAITCYYNTYYYRGLSTVYGEELTAGEGVVQEVALICADNPHDLTGAFITSNHGSEILIRAGVSLSAAEEYLGTERPHISTASFPAIDGSFVTLQDLGEFLLSSDESFKNFLFKQGVTPQLFKGANEWVWRIRSTYKKRQRWWSRDNLSKIRGVGADLSYGIAYNLKRFQRDIASTSSFSAFLGNTAYVNEVIEKIETTLTRIKSANVMLVGEAGVGKMDILVEFARRIHDGHSIASLTSKRIVVFDTDAFVATYNSKVEFEKAFLNLMVQTENAGNMVMVIENFAGFLRSVSAFNSSAGDLLGRFLVSNEIQLIASVEPREYHTTLETNQELLQYFESILIEVPDISSSVRVLEEATWVHEHTFNLYFTYPAVVRVAECAEQYIVEGSMPDKAVSLLADIAARAGHEKLRIVGPDYVEKCASEKTGIPIGSVNEKERDMLMNLEEVLHKRVVGQERAISVIASTMRRSRAGIQSKEKPIGVFLFLGSTGVGKTETAKALAYTFFGSEEHMVRFDMSEYSGEDGLERLLGTNVSAGTLPSALREHPYCVLLLDEFEKSSIGVRDLFLQVFDEGKFTDSLGSRVNARNCIIIATSNAGSDLIWKFVQEGKHPEDEKDTIISTIIERKIYKPELLNRFDSVVLFEVLGEKEQRTIAGFMLKDLKDRIKDRGYDLELNETLLTVLMKHGYDPEFGARPMRRAVQDLIEERIAKKILEGGLKLGDTIRFSPEDFEG